jgi:hypothetical protein
MSGKKRFQNIILACILLGKNFQCIPLQKYTCRYIICINDCVLFCQDFLTHRKSLKYPSASPVTRRSCAADRFAVTMSEAIG